MARDPDDLTSDMFISAQERDPMRAAAQGGRATLPQRFYERAEVAERDGGFAVLLDGKSVKTPARRPVAVPSKALAEALAQEWAAQGERIDPSSMPLTRLVNSAIDGVAERMAEVEADVVGYARSDLVSYRAAEPARLAAAQALAWDPLLAFAKKRLGAALLSTEGIVHMMQPEAAVAALRRATRAYVGDDAAAPFRLTALHVMTTLTGSCVIALAVAFRAIGLDEAWSAAHVDEDFQTKAWGEDREALERRAKRFEDMRAAAHVSGILGNSA